MRLGGRTWVNGPTVAFSSTRHSAQQTMIEDLRLRSDLDIDEANKGSHGSPLPDHRPPLEDRERPESRAGLDHDLPPDSSGGGVVDLHPGVEKREGSSLSRGVRVALVALVAPCGPALSDDRAPSLLPCPRGGAAQESAGATRAWNSASPRSGSKSGSWRAWLRLVGLAVIADRRAFRAASASPGAGLGGGQAVERVLVARVLGDGLAEILHRLVELAPVVEHHAVVQHLLERLRAGRLAARRPLAHREIRTGPLDEIGLIPVGRDQVVPDGPGRDRSPCVRRP